MWLVWREKDLIRQKRKKMGDAYLPHKYTYGQGEDRKRTGFFFSSFFFSFSLSLSITAVMA